MSWFGYIMSFLIQLQNYQLVQEIEACCWAGLTTQADVLACIESKINAANVRQGTPDYSVIQLMREHVRTAKAACQQNP